MPRAEGPPAAPVEVRPAVSGVLSARDVADTAATIAGAQLASGMIPWYPGGHTDPWDHVECAMALSAAGEWNAAQRAYAWLARTQRPDGSWPMRVGTDGVVDAGCDTNHCAYVAVGVWHHTLVTGDDAFARRMWPVVRRALESVLALRHPAGDVAWARDADGNPAPGALLAGCSSIHQGLRCAVALAERIGCPQPDWEWAAGELARVIGEAPDTFEDRRRYSMDWYYPVLGGAVRGSAANRWLDQRWAEFVVPGLGVRCVEDRPWVTGAETCELALALDAVGDRAHAVGLLADMQHLRDVDGAYWTGYVYADGVRWPIERSTWTGAAVILAADALSDATAGAALFREVAPNPAWESETGALPSGSVGGSVDGSAAGSVGGSVGGSVDGLANALEDS